jgi:hypothetical protein
MHTCKTQEGVEITLGLRVVDYDLKQGVVVRRPHEWSRELGAFTDDPAFLDGCCWPGFPPGGGNGHWWGVCSDRPGHVHVVGECRPSGDFDGSRLTTRGVE